MPKQLSKKEVKKIAELARLELTDEELDDYSKQLSDILEYVEKLREVDTQDVSITSQVTGLANVMRDDEIGPLEDSKELIGMAPQSEDNLVKVKAVFE